MSMLWKNNNLRATVRYYDELAFTSSPDDNPVSVTAIQAIVSGGTKGKFSLFPKEARGEWMDITFSDEETGTLIRGIVIWDGMSLEYAETPRP